MVLLAGLDWSPVSISRNMQLKKSILEFLKALVSSRSICNADGGGKKEKKKKKSPKFINEGSNSGHSYESVGQKRKFVFVRAFILSSPS